MDILEQLRGAVANLQRVVEGVGADQLTAPTPCEDFDVRGLAAHIVGGANGLAALVGGEYVDAGQLGDDLAGPAKQASERMLLALEAEGVLEREFDMGRGPMPGSRVAGIALMESVVHAWDLARATGQEHGIPDALADAVLGHVQRLPESYRGETGAPFKPPVPISNDAPIADRLAAFLGRQV